MAPVLLSVVFLTEDMCEVYFQLENNNYLISSVSLNFV